MPDIDDIIAFENGEMSEDQIIALFQQGIDAGWVWELQGLYQRTALALIESEACTQTSDVA